MDLLKSADQNKEIRHYLSEKVRQIEQVQRCISKRNGTLRELSELLVEWQTAFFQSGKGCLQPLRMQDADKALNLNESTISRAVKDKYLQCGWGILPMDYFFSKGVEDIDTGELIATEQIKLALKQIIDEEDKAKPLSNQKLAADLEKKGFSISRRTVAKYHESMGLRIAADGKSIYFYNHARFQKRFHCMTPMKFHYAYAAQKFPPCCATRREHLTEYSVFLLST